MTLQTIPQVMRTRWNESVFFSLFNSEVSLSVSAEWKLSMLSSSRNRQMTFCYVDRHVRKFRSLLVEYQGQIDSAV